MATLQVKRVPEDLHAAVTARAREEGITVSELVLRSLRQTVERPPMRRWLDEVERVHGDRPPRRFDIEGLMDDVRTER